MTECQNCGTRDDDWFLCRRKECPNKAPTTPPKTLRDEFAMAALQGLLANPSLEVTGPTEPLAKSAYLFADAMMRAHSNHKFGDKK